MAINVSNDAWITSYTSDGTNITIPIASLEGLSVGNAHTTTGDIRALALAFLKTLYNHQAALAAADKPAGMVISSRLSIPSEAEVNRNMGLLFKKNVTGTELIAES